MHGFQYKPSVMIYAVRQKSLIENNLKIDQRTMGGSKKMITVNIHKFLKTMKAMIL